MRAVLLISLVFATAVAAPELPAGGQVIHLKDGRELRGEVVSQNAAGYVLKTGDKTQLVPFADIQDMLPSEAPLTPPPPPPAEAPQPGYETQPPPPAREPSEA